jgi:acyl dehydratase
VLASPPPLNGPVPISPDHVGRTYPPTAPYTVSAAKIAEFADALGDSNPAYAGEDPVAPPTFAAVLGAAAWDALFADPELELALQRVVHADQTFAWHRPVRTGDTVEGVLTIDRVRCRGAMEIVGVTVRLATLDGEPLVDSSSTFVHTRAAS